MAESDVRALLGRLTLFRGIDDDALNSVGRHVVTRHLPAGSLLFREGQPCEGLYIVARGRVRVYRSSADGREQVMHTQEAGQPIAEVPLFDGGPYPASARTIEDSTVLFLARSTFRSLYHERPEIADAVIQDLGRRLRRMVRLVEKISLRDVPARMALTLIEYAESTDALYDDGEFRLPRTQSALAAELATTRESIARALARLRDAGAIAQQGARVRILSLDTLRRIAAGQD